jgi:hypothetical protein
MPRMNKHCETKSNRRLQPSDKCASKARESAPASSRKLILPATRVVRGKEKRIDGHKLSIRTTAAEHSFALWAADTAGFAGISHQVQTFFLGLCLLNQIRLGRNSNDTDIYIEMAGERFLLRPSHKRNFPKRHIWKETDNRIYLKSGRLLAKVATPLGEYLSELKGWIAP